jgi:hypothetical protein
MTEIDGLNLDMDFGDDEDEVLLSPAPKGGALEAALGRDIDDNDFSSRSPIPPPAPPLQLPSSVVTDDATTSAQPSTATVAAPTTNGHQRTRTPVGTLLANFNMTASVNTPPTSLAGVSRSILHHIDAVEAGTEVPSSASRQPNGNGNGNGNGNAAITATPVEVSAIPNGAPASIVPVPDFTATDNHDDNDASLTDATISRPSTRQRTAPSKRPKSAASSSTSTPEKKSKPKRPATATPTTTTTASSPSPHITASPSTFNSTKRSGPPRPDAKRGRSAPVQREVPTETQSVKKPPVPTFSPVRSSSVKKASSSSDAAATSSLKKRPSWAGPLEGRGPRSKPDHDKDKTIANDNDNDIKSSRQRHHEQLWATKQKEEKERREAAAARLVERQAQAESIKNQKPAFMSQVKTQMDSKRAAVLARREEMAAKQREEAAARVDATATRLVEVNASRVIVGSNRLVFGPPREPGKPSFSSPLGRFSNKEDDDRKQKAMAAREAERKALNEQQLSDKKRPGSRNGSVKKTSSVKKTPTTPKNDSKLSARQLQVQARREAAEKVQAEKRAAKAAATAAKIAAAVGTDTNTDSVNGDTDSVKKTPAKVGSVKLAPKPTGRAAAAAQRLAAARAAAPRVRSNSTASSGNGSAPSSPKNNSRPSTASVRKHTNGDATTTNGSTTSSKRSVKKPAKKGTSPKAKKEKLPSAMFKGDAAERKSVKKTAIVLAPVISEPLNERTAAIKIQRLTRRRAAAKMVCYCLALLTQMILLAHTRLCCLCRDLAFNEC